MDSYMTTAAERREQPGLIQARSAMMNNDLLIAPAARATPAIPLQCTFSLSSKQAEIPVMGEVARSTHATCRDVGSSATAEHEPLPHVIHYFPDLPYGIHQPSRNSS
jgi:hypothetical protein